MNDDLETLRAWRGADPVARVLVIEGPDASRGVRLLRFMPNGERQVAGYSTAGAAVTAIASGAVRWRLLQAPEGKLSWSRDAAVESKRKGGRRGGGRRKLAKTRV